MNGQTYPRRSGGGINVVLGIWLVISAFVLGFTRDETAKWNDIIVGIAVAVLALSGLNLWNFGLGIWLIISPFVLGFTHDPIPLRNNIVMGILVSIVALLSRRTRPAISARPPTT